MSFAPILSLVALSLLLACAREAHPGDPAEVHREAPLVFQFKGHEGALLSSESTRGRATAVVFVTTYDLGSQLLLRRVDEAVRTHRPRANAGAVVMEAPRYEVLLDTYAEAMELSYPIVLADLATREGRGPFGPMNVLPVVVILDAEGRVIARHEGPVTLPVILEGLRTASPEGRGER